MNRVLKFFDRPIMLLLLILLLALSLRLYKLEWPVADWHSWRQVDTAAVARNFYKEGFNPLVPKYDDMNAYSEKQIFNPNRYRFVEFPIYNSIAYFAYLLNGGVDEKYARLVSVFFSLGSIIFLYLLTRRYFETEVALLAALLFAILPYNVYFSRVILPEPTLIFFSLGAMYFSDRFIWEKKLYLYFLSIFFIACALLVKPMAIFFLLPLFYSVIRKELPLFLQGKYKQLLISMIIYLLLVIIAIIPFIAWRIWMTNFPEGIPASAWLFNGNNIRFRPSFWHWIFVERLGKEILFATGLGLFFIGIMIKPIKSKGAFLHLFALSMFLYLMVFATGNVQHDYYQVIIVPVLCIFMGRALYYLFKGIPDVISRIYSIPLAVFLLSLSIGMTWWYTKDFWQVIDERVHIVGRHVDQVLPKDAKVVAPSGGDTTFLYYINRPGFAVMAFPLESLRDQFGIDYYIALNYDEDANNALKRFATVEKTANYIIFDLHKEIRSK